MKLLSAITLPGILLTLAPLTEVRAARAECESPLGSCEVSNDDGEDFVGCSCEDGSGTGADGGDQWAGLTSEQLMEVCEAQIPSFCGEPGEPTGIPCESELGICHLDQERGFITCTCVDGAGGGGSAGSENPWADLSEAEVRAACEEELASVCAPGGETDGGETGGGEVGGGEVGGGEAGGGEAGGGEAGGGEVGGGEAGGDEAGGDEGEAGEYGGGGTGGGSKADDDEGTKDAGAKGCAAAPGGRGTAATLGVGLLGLLGLRRRRLGL